MIKKKRTGESVAIGKRIKLARAYAHLTQVETCILLDCKQSELSRWESGDRVPEDQRLEDIAKKMNSDFKWLKYGDQSLLFVEKMPYGEDYTFKHYAELDDKQKDDSLTAAQLYDSLEEPYSTIAYSFMKNLKVLSDSHGEKEPYKEIIQSYDNILKTKEEKEKHATQPTPEILEAREVGKFLWKYPNLYKAYNCGDFNAEGIKKIYYSGNVPDKYK